MKSIYILLIFSTFAFLSCDTTKKVANTSSENNTSVRDEKDDTQDREKILSDNGFVKAIVKKLDCGFVLEDAATKKIYYPVQWIVEEYKVEGKEVYVKYNTPSNQNNDCPKAINIVMEEIKLIR
jgi:hypothetical protein